MKRIVRIDGREGVLDWTQMADLVKASVAWNGDDAGQHALDVREVEKGIYSVLAGFRSYEVRISAGRDGWLVEVDGHALVVEVADPRDGRARGKGKGSEGRRDVTSPMPGKVIRVLVEAGATVEEGQGLVVVEAMKMQNEMKAPKTGVVIALAARAGASVTAGEVLVTLE